MITNLFETFEKYADEYGHFERIVNPMHMRPDIHAFLLLSFLVPLPGQNIIDYAESRTFYRGQETKRMVDIFLGVGVEKLGRVASEEDIRDLVRCGVRYEETLNVLYVRVSSQ
jgi:hypothetical protein